MTTERPSRLTLPSLYQLFQTTRIPPDPSSMPLQINPDSKTMGLDIYLKKHRNIILKAKQ